MQRRQDVPDNDLVDVLAHVGLLARRWHIVIAGLALGLIIAAVYTRTAAPLYRASMKLIVVPARLERATGPVRVEPGIAEAYIPFVRNADSLERAITSAGLNAPEQRWKLARLGERLTVNLSRQAPVLELALDFPDPADARVLLEAIAKEAIGLNTQLLSQSDADSRAFLEQRVGDAQKRLQAAQVALTEFHEASRLSERQGQLKAIVRSRARVNEILIKAEVDSSELGGNVAELSAALGQQSKILSLTRNLAEEPAAQAASGRSGPGNTRVEAEVINPLYEEVEPLLAVERGRLAAKRASAKRLVGELKAVDAQITSLSEAVQRDQITLDRLKLDFDVAQQTYKTVVAQYEAARIAVTAQSADLKVFERAQVGGRPVWPRPLPSALLGAALGAIAGLIVAAALAVRERVSGAPPVRKDERVASV